MRRVAISDEEIEMIGAMIPFLTDGEFLDQATTQEQYEYFIKCKKYLENLVNFDRYIKVNWGGDPKSNGVTQMWKKDSTRVVCQNSGNVY